MTLKDSLTPLPPVSHSAEPVLQSWRYGGLMRFMRAAAGSPTWCVSRSSSDAHSRSRPRAAFSAVECEHQATMLNMVLRNDSRRCTDEVLLGSIVRSKCVEHSSSGCSSFLELDSNALPLSELFLLGPTVRHWSALAVKDVRAEVPENGQVVARRAVTSSPAAKPYALSLCPGDTPGRVRWTSPSVTSWEIRGRVSR
jgi:hypothetical protein